MWERERPEITADLARKPEQLSCGERRHLLTSFPRAAGWLLSETASPEGRRPGSGFNWRKLLLLFDFSGACEAADHTVLACELRALLGAGIQE